MCFYVRSPFPLSCFSAEAIVERSTFSKIIGLCMESILCQFLCIIATLVDANPTRPATHRKIYVKYILASYIAESRQEESKTYIFMLSLHSSQLCPKVKLNKNLFLLLFRFSDFSSASSLTLSDGGMNDVECVCSTPFRNQKIPSISRS